MAGPLRFRRSEGTWTRDRIRTQLLAPLDERFGARLDDTWFSVGDTRYDAVRLDMENGDFALFAFGPERAYWLGNTETPEVLWRTDKETFAEAPYAITRWAERELTARLEVTDPWLAEFEYVTWFFLPVFFSKDGRDTTRRFFDEDAAGFPDASRETGLDFYESLFSTGTLDEYRYTMASKLGTSPASTSPACARRWASLRSRRSSPTPDSISSRRSNRTAATRSISPSTDGSWR